MHQDKAVLVEIAVHETGHDYDDEGYSYMWIISPTTDYWVRARDNGDE